jgi:hypothetical protein
MVLPYNGSLEQLQWFVQTTMPAVYDDSLSYYELLAKVLAQLNTNTDFVNGVNTTLTDLINLVNSEKWVDNSMLKDDSVDGRIIKNGSVGLEELDQAILAEPTTAIGQQAKFLEIDNQLSNKVDFTNDNVNPVYIAPFFRTNGDTSVDLYASLDGTNFTVVSDTPLFSERDTSLMFYEGYWYAVTTQHIFTPSYEFLLYRSKDLKRWESYPVHLGLVTDQLPKAWAPEWFLDTDGKVYVLFSLQTGTLGDGSVDMRPYLVEATDLKTLVFGQARRLNLGAEDRCWIDGFIYKKESTYYLFIKKEPEGKIQIWTSSDLTAWTKQVDTITNLDPYYAEAPSIAKVGDTYYLYFDNANGDHGGNMQYCTSNDLISWSAPVRISGENTRHGTVYQVTDRDAKLSLNDYMETNNIKRIVKTRNYVSLDALAVNGVIDTLSLSNGTVYACFNQNITINHTVFADDGTITPYKVYFAIFNGAAANCSITLKNGNGKIFNPLQQDYVMKASTHADVVVEFGRTYQSPNSDGLRQIGIDQASIKAFNSALNRVDLSALATGGVITSLQLNDNTLYTSGNNVTVNAVSVNGIPNTSGRVYFMSYGAAVITLVNGAGGNMYLPNQQDYIISSANGNNETYVAFCNDNGGLRRVI